MNVFSTEINQHNTVPPLWKLFVLSVISVIMSLLYLVVSILTACTLGGCYLEDADGLLVVSILEIVLTLFSLFLSIMATHISDCIQDNFTDRLKRVYESNPFLQDEFKISKVIERAEKNKKISRNIKRVIFAFFFLYFITSCLHIIRTDSMIIQGLVWGFGSLSTVFSVFLAVTSSFSCYTFGDCVMVLLEMLNKGINLLFDEYNNRRISDSFEQFSDKRKILDS